MLVKVPSPLKLLYPRRIWSIPSEDKAVYLTFDDGPIPEITPWVLEQLQKYRAKATFFCIGENVQKHPEVFQKVLDAGHSIGNHSHNHLNGWKTPTGLYLENVLQAEEILEKFAGTDPAKEKLFRPPYGRIKDKQAKLLEEKNFRIVMWDVISVDYDSELTPERCFRNVIDNTVPGSLIVFHDSLKAEKNLKVVLPRVLEYYSEQGFSFRSIDCNTV